MKMNNLENEEESGKSKSSNFLVQGSFLAIASVLVRFIGMIYRIPMVNIIGSEGNGYYSTAYSVYSILLLFSSYSMPLAVSKMVSERVSLKKWKETGKILHVALIFGTVVGLIFALLCYFGADFFCTTVMKSPLSATPLKMMAPTIFIMALLGVLRGFFQGFQTMLPTAISQILEQIVNALVSIGAAYFLFSYGKELVANGGEEGLAASWGAAGGTIGTGAGALTAFIFMLILYFKFRPTLKKRIHRNRKAETFSSSGLMKILIFTAVPVILSTATYNCIDLIDNALFNNAMSKAGQDFATYNATWGDYNSAYLLLIHLPVALASAMASALVPSLSAAYARGEKKEVLEKIALTMRVTTVIAVPCAFAFTVIGGSTAKLLFPSIQEGAEQYLLIGSLAVITYSLSTVTNAILQSLSEMNKPVLHALISLAIHTGLLFLLLYVFKMGITAVILSYMVFSLCMSIMNLFSIYNKMGYLPDPVRTFAIPFAGGLLVALICLFVSFLTSAIASNRLAYLIILVGSILIAVPVYLLFILWSGCLSTNQLRQLPFGRKLISLSDKLHFGRH